MFLLATGYSGVENILKLIGLIILCALIIAASYFVTRFIGKREAGMTGKSNFKTIDAFRLSPNKYLQLIQVGTRYLVIAVSKDNVSLLCELSEEDIVYWREEGKKVSFKDIMAKAIGKDSGKSEEEDIADRPDQNKDESESAD